tara:strand:- start:403 stop:1083 length:681 start_codon:yes stop_codon:yes gene_type:complete
MGTISLNRGGFLKGAIASDFESAGTATSSSSVNDNFSSADANAIQYFKSSGRGGGSFRFTRTFLHFDTSAVSGGSNFVLNIPGSLNAEANVKGIKHTAGSSNGSAIVSNDFDNIDHNTVYFSSASWSTGSNAISLSATAANQIINNNDFNIAILGIEDDGNYGEDPIEASAGDFNRGVNFGGTINITFTDPSPSGYGHKTLTVAAASISKVSTVATANIGKINTVD